jgi:hypothetical protein
MARGDVERAEAGMGREGRRAWEMDWARAGGEDGGLDWFNWFEREGLETEM